MKICHIADRLPLVHNTVGGAEWAAQRVINAQKDILDVLVITSSRAKEFESDLKIYEVPLSFKGFLTNVRLGLLPFNRKAYQEIKEILKGEKPDIVHLHNFKYFGFSTLQVAKELGIKVIYSLYDYWFFCPLSLLYIKKERKVCNSYHGIGCIKCFNFPGIGFFFRKILFNRYKKLIDHFLVISQDSKSILTDNEIAEEQITLSSLVIEDPKIQRVKKIKNTILYVGWIVPHKGLDVLIRGIEGTDYELIVAGDGIPSYTERCKSIADMLNIRVKFIGRIPNKEVIEWMNKCEFLAVADEWRIPLPTVMLEAMSVGCKVIGNKIGCMKYLFPQENLFNGKEDIVKCLKNAKFFETKLDNEKTINEMIEVYKEVSK